jgi:hypothetical protein
MEFEDIIHKNLSHCGCCERVLKRAYLERQSTTMMTDLFPNLGKPTMKSIEIFIQIVGGSGSGWSVPRGLTVSPLLH